MAQSSAQCSDVTYKYTQYEWRSPQIETQPKSSLSFEFSPLCCKSLLPDRAVMRLKVSL